MARKKNAGTPREVARKTYENGGFGTQSAGLSFDGTRWVVSAWDHWAHSSLEDAKAHYRSIGA